METGEGTLGTTSDYFPLICYRYDPERAAYVPRVAEMLMAGVGFAFVVGFGGWLSWQWRRSRTRSGPGGRNGLRSVRSDRVDLPPPGAGLMDPASRVRREDARSGDPAAAPAAV